MGLQLRLVYDIIPFAVRDDGGKYRGVEQLVARRAHNPKVVGSSPASATKKTVKTFVFTVFSLNRQGNLYPIFYMRRDPKNS